jgi:hypothetical protein
MKMKSVLHNQKEFKQIPGDDRFVSCDGEILSFRSGAPKLMALVPDFDGYLKVSRPEIKVHHAVLLAWIGARPVSAQARHLDGVKVNNHAGNLVWGTAKENGNDKRLHGNGKGERNGAAKMTAEFVLKLREEYKSKSLSVLRKENSDFSQFAIWAAVSGYTWSHLPGAIPKRRTCYKQ